ncbi:DUF618 domain-containing protein [Verticillium dahliae]|nr:DUF618 domain-containing protein [Verticillium dahliae]
MAFSDDAVLARLSSRNESPTSIDGARFVLAFAPIIAEALAVAYKGAPAEIQGKLRRVVEEKTSLPTKTSLGTADQDWDKLHDPLASAEGAVADSVKARRALISELEKKTETEEKRREVENAIMRTLPSQESWLGHTDGQSIGTSDISLRQATTTESPRPSLSGPYAGPPASGMEMLLGADDGIDADVAEMLRKDSNGA